MYKGGPCTEELTLSSLNLPFISVQSHKAVTAYINPCPATPEYIQFQADFKSNIMPLKMDNIVFGRCSVSQII